MNAERVGGLFWFIFGLIVMYGCFKLDIGSLHAPGSGFLGFLASAFVTLMALIVLIQSFFSRIAQRKVSMLWKEIKWRRPLAVAFLILLYILGLERLGFVLTSLLLLLVTFKWVEKFSWPKTLLATVLSVGFSYLLFHTFLKASLPRGFWGF